MADQKTIKTRIALRNNDLSVWESGSLKDTVLLKGETAFAKLSTGDYYMRVGTGDKTWNELSDSGRLVIKASQVEGLEETIASLSTSYYSASSLSELSNTSTYVNGDIAVVTSDIDGTHTSYTAYRFNSQISDWQALDGNYNAENVYFSKDLTYTKQIGELPAVPSSGAATLSAKGKNVKQIFDTILAKEANPTTTYPTYTFSASGSEGSAEVGSTYTVPTATFKYTDDGSYTYGPDPTGVKVEAGKVTVQRTTTGETASKTNDAELAINGTVIVPAGSTGVTLLDYESRVTYSYTCTAEHTAGDVPVTNLGNEYTAGKIAAGTTWDSGPITASATFYGYRNLWLGSTADGTSAIDETWVKNNLTKVKADSSKKYEIGAGTSSKTSGYTHLTLATGAKRIIVVLPASGKYKRTLSQVLLQSASNTPVTDSYKLQASQIDIGGAVAGANTMKYNVYVYQPDAIGSDEVHDISIG